ncbi:YceH family protein [Lysobacter tyrosinilyticus]
MTETPVLPLLNAAEARVLGCLIEKEATTPDTYPLTVNAAQVAANQKTARDPVMTLEPGEVNHTLRQLETKGLAKQVFSSRAERYEHRTGAVFSLPRQQVALLGLLLLRGAQTVHELLARSERLAKFEDADDVRHHLERLIQRLPALVVQIPRGPGQREDRYAHLLSGPVDVAAISERLSQRSEAEASPLEARVAALESEVAALREEIAALRG